VVIAAGTATGYLAEKFGVKVPLASGRVEILVTEPVERFRHGGVDGNGIYGRQTLRGNLLYGGGPHEWQPDVQPSNARNSSTPLFRFIAGKLTELFPAARHARILRSWAGTVENTPDGRPIIDRPGAFENVVLATLSSVGFGLSPASGRAIAELILHGKCAFADISSVSLKRFNDLAPDWREARGWLPVHAPSTA
jgi:sarcosine oxidase subunit beta